MENIKSSSKVERKTLEKQRRMSMKSLCMNLSSLIPNQNSMYMMTLPDQLHEATNYIKNLEKKIESIKERKKLLLGNGGNDLGFRFPILEVKILGSALEVVLISESFYQKVFYAAISVLQDEEAEIVSASFYTREGKTFHTIHSQITDCRVWQTTRICEKLKSLVP